MRRHANPLLQFVLIDAETDADSIDIEDVVKQCVHECAKAVNGKVAQILSGNASDVVISENTKSHSPAKTPDTSRNRSSKKSGGKSSGERAAPKISVRQLRYIGYLLRQKGEEPDYKTIAEMTQREATMRIKELEREASVGK